MKFYAVIVAGGSGNRMKAGIPKQFLILDGRPVLMHTIEAFYHSELRPAIILVLNPDFYPLWGNLCAEYGFEIPHQLVPGGKERFYSVKNAIDVIEEDSIIAIHDAVRPVVSDELITRCFKEAEKKGAVIPVTESRDSLRKKENNATRSISREDILIVQTPQVFQSSLLKIAYQQDYTRDFTDDASVVEKSGITIHTTSGDLRNIKITYPDDLQVASCFLRT